MLTPSIKLHIVENLLSLNDNDLILVNGIITDIKTNKDRKQIYKLINELEEESNYFKEKAINRVLRISDDKCQELMDVIELLNNPLLTNKEVRGIKYYITGYLNQKYNEKMK